MGEKKVIVMILKVDLQCDCCYKRVKKALCKFSEIRDRIFDEKSNTVMIKVICCDPEKLRYDLCNKGRGSIKSIEIKELEVPKPAENPKPDTPNPQETTPAPKPEPPKNPPPAKSPEPVQKPPEPVKEQSKPPKPSPDPTSKAPDSAPKPVNSEPNPVEPMPSYGSEPIPTSCEQCYGGRAGGPCNYGHGPPPLGYIDGYYYGRMGYDGYGPNQLCHPGQCAEYFSEENPAGCSVM